MKPPANTPKFEAFHSLAERMQGTPSDAAVSCMDVLQTATAMRKGLNERFFSGSMSEGRFTVLTLLLTAPDGTLSPSELATAAGVSRATMTGLLDGLEEEGLVRRSPHKMDRRRLTVRITAQGRRTILELAPALFEELKRIGEALAQNRRSSLASSLRRLREASG